MVGKREGLVLIAAIVAISIIVQGVSVVVATEDTIEVNKEVTIEVLFGANDTVRGITVEGRSYLLNSHNKADVLIEFECLDCPDCTLNADGLEDEIVANISGIVTAEIKKLNASVDTDDFADIVTESIASQSDDLSELVKDWLQNQDNFSALESQNTLNEQKIWTYKQNESRLMADITRLQNDYDKLENENANQRAEIASYIALLCVLLVIIVAWEVLKHGGYIGRRANRIEHVASGDTDSSNVVGIPPEIVQQLLHTNGEETPVQKGGGDGAGVKSNPAVVANPTTRARATLQRIQEAKVDELFKRAERGEQLSPEDLQFLSSMAGGGTNNGDRSSGTNQNGGGLLARWFGR